jgi:hypothetical protein
MKVRRVLKKVFMQGEVLAKALWVVVKVYCGSGVNMGLG